LSVIKAGFTAALLLVNARDTLRINIMFQLLQLLGYRRHGRERNRPPRLTPCTTCCTNLQHLLTYINQPKELVTSQHSCEQKKCWVVMGGADVNTFLKYLLKK